MIDWKDLRGAACVALGVAAPAFAPHSAAARAPQEDAPVEVPTNADEVTAEVRLAQDGPLPELPAIPDRIPGGERVKILREDGSVAREGWLLDGARAGVWIAYAPDGTVVEHGAYRGYARVGPWKIVTDRGLVQRGHFDGQGRRHGLWYVLSPDGSSVRVRAEWSAGLRDGLRERFDRATGKLLARSRYARGRLAGDSVKFDPGTGVLVEEGRHERGVPVGPWRELHPNGVPRAVGAYVSGLKHGQWIEYHPTGSRRLVGTYDRGRRVGEWRGFHRLGDRHSIAHFKDGLPHGSYIAYWPNGQRRAEGEYVDGVQQGVWTFWDEAGVVDARGSGTYVDGELVR